MIDGVVDFDAYNKMLELEKDKAFNEEFRYLRGFPEDPQLVFDTWNQLNLEERTRTLKPSNVGLCRAKVTYRNKIMAKHTSLKSAAYGHKMVKPGQARTHHMVLDDHKDVLLTLFGQFFSDQEVIAYCATEMRLMGIGLSQVKRFRQTYSERIAQLQEEHRRDSGSVRLFHKKSRLLELSELYAQRKMLYQVDNSPVSHRLLLQTLEQIRKEAEGEKITIDHNVEVTMTQVLNYQSYQEVMSNLPIMEIILGRVASSLRLDPKVLIWQLRTSHYSKNTGYGSTFEDAVVDPYPSTVHYDLANLEAKTKEFESQRQAIQVDTQAPPVEGVNDLLSSLRQLAKDRTQAVERSGERL